MGTRKRGWTITEMLLGNTDYLVPSLQWPYWCGQPLGQQEATLRKLWKSFQVSREDFLLENTTFFGYCSGKINHNQVSNKCDLSGWKCMMLILPIMSISSQSRPSMVNTWHTVPSSCEHNGKGPGEGKGHWHFRQAPVGQVHLNTAVQGTEVFQELLGSSLQVGVTALGHGQDAL